ncbi:salicylate synthase [Streptomyces nanshensis]|uniref:Chorismate-utilising enzyme C-terminal domain-containing protein n=1 Tax=Streptomyces nanshensis TaxID=518642 RepID=A0A1E7L9J8_9ACTN|nr:salicylate synthase [Streptomyces nanshensis]OEV12818.1 hypothetical protein AN218_06265 [Streptomyces nanshensis]
MEQQHYEHACIDGPLDPMAFIARLADSGLLTDYVVYERDDHWHVAGNPSAEIRVDAHTVRTTRAASDETAVPWTASPWQAIRAALDGLPVVDWNAFGWLAFELADVTKSPPASALAGEGGEEGDGLLAHLIVPRTELTVTEDRIHVRTLEPEITERLAKVLSACSEHTPDPVLRPVTVHGARKAYEDQVAYAVGQIGKGELDKVILSRSVELPFTVDMTATYVRGRAANTPARSFLLDLGGRQAAGFSPETVVEVSAGGTAVTQPLAGTRALTGVPETDTALRTELRRDAKEVYEHATSVKLAVEELDSVGIPHTTHIREFLAVKPRGSVQHLASRVATELSEERTAWDALSAVFPPVTASGIPKQAAYRLIRELEDRPRGMYAGAVVLAGADGSLDAALVLRAVYQHGGRAWLRAGAGVVGASRPSREYEETCEKLLSVAPYVVPKES